MRSRPSPTISGIHSKLLPYAQPKHPLHVSPSRVNSPLTSPSPSTSLMPITDTHPSIPYRYQTPRYQTLRYHPLPIPIRRSIPKSTHPVHKPTNTNTTTRERKKSISQQSSFPHFCILAAQQKSYYIGAHTHLCAYTSVCIQKQSLFLLVLSIVRSL
jgi:hypothetical protein